MSLVQHCIQLEEGMYPLISVELPILSRKVPRSGSSLVKRHFLIPESELLHVV